MGEGRTKQWGTETLGDLWKGEGSGGEHGAYKMDTTRTSGRKTRNLKEVGVEKIMVLDGGRLEMVVNSCFEDLEERVGLKRVWSFVPKTGKTEE